MLGRVDGGGAEQKPRCANDSGSTTPFGHALEPTPTVYVALAHVGAVLTLSAGRCPTMAPTNLPTPVPTPPTPSPTVPKAGALHVWAARATTVSDALAAGATCYGVGDPHYKSFDGSYFDFYGKGQFYLVKSNQLQIQTLLTQLPSNSYVSFHTGVAFAGPAMRGSTLQVLGGAGGLGVSPRPTRDEHAVALLLVHSKGRSRRSRFLPCYGTALVRHPDQRLELTPVTSCQR